MSTAAVWSKGLASSTCATPATRWSWRRPGLIDQLAATFGSQCVVLAIDAKRSRQSAWEAYVAGGRVGTGRDTVCWASEGVNRGAGEILLTSMDRDGTNAGYDLPLVS